MDDEELARNRQEVSTFTAVMAPLMQSALARVAAATPTKPLRPFSANTMLTPKHRSPMPLAHTGPRRPARASTCAAPSIPVTPAVINDDRDAIRGPDRTTMTTLLKPRPKTPLKKRSHAKSNQVDVETFDGALPPVLADAKGSTKRTPSQRPRTASGTAARQLKAQCSTPGTTHSPPKPTKPAHTSPNAIQRAKLLANKLRPKSAAVQPSPMISDVMKKKRPRPPSAWSMIQSQATSFGPLSPTGEVDRVSIDLTKQEVSRQREVTASAHKVFNEVKHTRDTKQIELAHLHRQIAQLTKETTASSSETSTAMDLSTQMQVLQLQIAQDKDQSAKCRHYKRVLEHVVERTKLDSAAIVARTKVLHHQTTVVEKEWAALDSRMYTLDNLAAHTLKRLDQLRLDQAAKRDDQAVTLKFLRSEAEQSQELQRRRVEADRKRRNLVMTFRSPHGGNNRPRLSRMDTHLLLLRESALTSREAEFDWLVAQTGETDVALLMDRFVQYEHAMTMLRQLQLDGVAAHARLDKEHARLQAEVYELRACGSDQVLETQRKVKGMLEDELWLAQATEDTAQQEMQYYQGIVTAMHQGLHSILLWLQCVDPMGSSDFKSQPLEALPSLCINVFQTHLASLETYSTQALHELLETLPVNLWRNAPPNDESVVDDDVDDFHRTSNYENATRRTHAARILEPKALCKQDSF
ncbi:hypothetical protein H310_07339 [Aphanomyces invadans]|uniref:Uncharacterized protein n=1 Tax=Aphanomyces invadans TaxID=157072 RepID=A0A024U308_9STRA|nr:hypothetical protein H310_07339 [Aphanomyces invadans]ETW00806.1 hypothetical protein H310_07339 [Aphanomyces invadans]|eukprot:XP_008870941.1 hypothetical protein H310_07339 [Aphanomyces invadans]